MDDDELVVVLRLTDLRVRQLLITINKDMEYFCYLHTEPYYSKAFQFFSPLFIWGASTVLRGGKGKGGPRPERERKRVRMHL